MSVTMEGRVYAVTKRCNAMDALALIPGLMRNSGQRDLYRGRSWPCVDVVMTWPCMCEVEGDMAGRGQESYSEGVSAF